MTVIRRPPTHDQAIALRGLARNDGHTLIHGWGATNLNGLAGRGLITYGGGGVRITDAGRAWIAANPVLPENAGAHPAARDVRSLPACAAGVFPAHDVVREILAGPHPTGQPDGYRHVAAAYFGVDYADVTDTQRTAVKSACFAQLYGKEIPRRGRPPLPASTRRREYASVMLTEAETELAERARTKLDPVPLPAVFARDALLTRSRRR